MTKNYEMPDIIEVKALDNYLIYLKYETNQWENGEDVSPENLYYNSINSNEFQGSIKQLD